MSRIEELPDDFDESLNIKDHPPASASPRFSPQTSQERKENVLSQSMASPPQPSAQEDVATILNKTPLFMNSLDNAADDGALVTPIRMRHAEKL